MSQPEDEKTSRTYRKLSALMFTDMAGYSKLTDENEELAIELLEEHRIIVRKILEKHNGFEIETAGDSFFVEFSSASEALKCSIEIQKNFYERNSSAAPERKILVRIGLHIGDVVHLGRHVHGDGVNTAARLEPLAIPGGICLSQDFFRAVSNNPEYPLDSKGKVLLKNISSPVEIFYVRLPWLKDVPSKNLRTGSKSRIKYFYTLSAAALIIMTLAWFLVFNQNSAELKKRIAVLPFTNISSINSDEYFADGLTEQLITVLSNISGFSVIARSSVMQYKDQERDIGAIAEMLNVNTVLEGTIRRNENNTRITVNLIDVETMENLWSKGYDSPLEDLLMVQGDIANNVADELKIKLHINEMEKLKQERKIHPEAYRNYLLGRFYLNKRSADAFYTSIEHFKKAIENDSSYAEAYAGLADVYNLMGSAGFGSLDPETTEALALQNVMKAIEIDPTLADAHTSLANINFRIQWNFTEAENEFKRAIELSPGNAQALEWYALFTALRGKFNDALNLMNRAHELNPLSSSVMTGIGRIHYFKREYDKAVVQFQKTIAMDPGYAEAYHSLGLAYIAKKNYTLAIANIKKAISLSGNRPILKANLGYAYGSAGMKDSVELIIKEFDSLSRTEYISPYNYVLLYAGLNDQEKAVKYMRLAVKERYGLTLYMKVEPLADPLKKNPEFMELINQTGI